MHGIAEDSSRMEDDEETTWAFQTGTLRATSSLDRDFKRHGQNTDD